MSPQPFAVFTGQIKPQLDHQDPSYQAALARCLRLPPAAAAVDATAPAPWTSAQMVIAPREPIRPDPPGAQRRAPEDWRTPVHQARPRGGLVDGRTPARLLAWVGAQDRPVSLRDCQATFADVNPEHISTYLGRLRRAGRLVVRRYRLPAQFVVRTQFQPAGRDWPPLPPGAVLWEIGT